MHCDDSSCSGGQGSPLGNAPNIELRNINGQILMMPKRPSLDTVSFIFGMIKAKNHDDREFR